MRLVSLGQPEQLTLHRIDKILALERIGLTEAVCIHFLRQLDGKLAKQDLRFEARIAPVWQLAVKLMPPLADSEGRIKLEIPFKKALHVAVPA